MLMLSYLMTDVLHLQIFAVQIKQKNIRFLLNLSLSIVVMLLRKKKKKSKFTQSGTIEDLIMTNLTHIPIQIYPPPHPEPLSAPHTSAAHTCSFTSQAHRHVHTPRRSLTFKVQEKMWTVF